MARHYYIGDHLCFACSLDEDDGEAELAGAVPTMRARVAVAAVPKTQRCPDADIVTEADRACGGGGGPRDGTERGSATNIDGKLTKVVGVLTGEAASSNDAFGVVIECKDTEDASKISGEEVRVTGYAAGPVPGPPARAEHALSLECMSSEDGSERLHEADSDGGGVYIECEDTEDARIEPGEEGRETEHSGEDALPEAPGCAEHADHIECKSIKNEYTGISRPERWSDMASDSDELQAKQAEDESDAVSGRRRRPRRPRRRQGQARTACLSVSPSRSASAASVSSAACPHVAEPTDNWAIRLLQAAAVHLEGGDFGAALEAHVRLLLGDERLPSEQLFNVSYLRERGGWRATITIATGRQFAGAVRAGQRAAYASAMESAMDHVIDAGLSITQAVGDRLKKFEPSTTRSGGK